VLWTFGPAIVEALQLPSEDALARDFWDSKLLADMPVPSRAS
jgi:hypothetical protein